MFDSAHKFIKLRLRFYNLSEILMTKVVYLDEDDRKLILETRHKLGEVTKLMEELLETVEILSDREMMKKIRQGQADIKAGRVKELRRILKGTVENT